MAGKTKFTKTEFKAAVIKSKGIKSEIARLLNCSYNTVTNYLNRKTNADLAELFDSYREVMVDTLESKFMEAVNEGDIRAIIFGLETIGKGRGWTKRTEITGADGGAIQLSSDVSEMLKKHGVSLADVQSEFEAMVRAMVANGNDNG